MNKRDKAILADLQRFRVMDRDSIVELHFDGLKRPENSANNVLKRLYRDKHIDRSTQYNPYLYFPSDTTIKKSSQKIPHFLKILQVYKDILMFDEPRIFQVEPKYSSKGTVEPDIFTIFKRTPFFIEAQCTQYSEKVMQKKLERYVDLFESGIVNGEHWQPSNKSPIFPYILILSDTRYAIDQDYPFQVFQAQNIYQFMDSINQKPKEKPMSNNGEIKIRVG